MIQYRIAKKIDAPTIAALAKEIWREHYTALIGANQVDYMLERFQSEAVIAAAIACGTEYYLACEEGGPIGYVALKPEPEYLFLSKLYVLKPWRGHGIAKHFVQMAKAVACRLGVGRIRLTVNKGNSGSIVAYQRMGFIKIDEAVTDIGDGYVMDDDIMESEAGS